MKIERASTNTFTLAARPTLSPSNWLLRFVKVESGLEVLCIASAYAVAGSPVRLSFDEVASSPTATDGEVTLSLGQWQLTAYEQTSAVNLNYTLAGREVFTTLVEVVGAAVPDPPPTDPCSGGGGGGTVTITGTDGLTQLPPVDCGDTYPLPDTHIFFQDNVGQPGGVLLGLGTVVEEGDGHLYPDIVVPSRYVKNTEGNNANTFRATLEDLVNDTLPIAQDGFWSLKDTDGNELNTGSIPSNASADITAPDATVTRDGLPFGTVLSGGTIDVPSAPCDPELSLRLNGGRVIETLDLDCGLQEYDIIVTTEGSTPIGTYDNVEGRIEVTPGQVQLVDSAANPIGSPVSIEPESGGNTITAPDGSVTIRNSVPTTLHTVAVRSNGSATQDIADSTITRPDGTTVGLPATVALDVRDYRSGIVYNFGYILASGQTASYRSGDEGSYRTAGFFNYTRPVYPLAYAELSAGTWDTLAANNIHGNTLRFTNRAGGAAATSGNRVIQDHFTGLEWYIPSSLPADTTWNAAIDASEASTVESSTDWMLPTDRMLDTITRDDQTVPLNQTPFNILTAGSASLWTSTTSPDDTTQARRCVNGGGGGLFGRSAKSGNNGSYIFCRKFL